MWRFPPNRCTIGEPTVGWNVRRPTFLAFAIVKIWFLLWILAASERQAAKLNAFLFLVLLFKRYCAIFWTILSSSSCENGVKHWEQNYSLPCTGTYLYTSYFFKASSENLCVLCSVGCGPVIRPWSALPTACPIPGRHFARLHAPLC